MSSVRVEITDEAIVQLAKEYARPHNIENREDIEQEVAIALLTARERFNPNLATWKTYARQIALYAIQEYWRNHFLWDRSEQRTIQLEEYDVTLLGRRHSTEHEYLDLDAWLQGLTSMQQKIIVLMLLGYRRREIKSLLHISTAQIDRLRLRLRIENSNLFYSPLTDTAPLKLAA